MEGPSLAQPLASSRATALPRRWVGLPLPRVLLCDLDGTLIDTMPTLADLAAEVMSEAYAMPRSLAREMYVATCGLPFFQQLEAICPQDQRNPTVAARFEAAKPALCRSARMPADTRRALITLQGRGVRIVVSSNNGKENVDAFAASSGFAFDLVLGFGEGLAKGAPHITRAEEAFQIGRGEMMFVGDSLHDGEIAAATGIPFVGLAGTFSKERFALKFPHLPVVGRFSELVDLFD
ncbi:MAG TPA: HAD hydrolase-like protein [Polyangia bacterium]|nr:HAD hydrolase-like protein [Polyangia bacterium]